MKLIKSNCKYTIYKITCKENGRFYIGCTVNYENRKAQHLSKLFGNYHHNAELQKDYDKYGESAFTYEVLLKTDQAIMEFLITYQYYWNPLLYNKVYGTKRVKDEHDRTPIVDLTTGIKYRSISEASRMTGINEGNIQKCCKHKYKSTGRRGGEKHIFVYWEELLNNPSLLPEATEEELRKLEGDSNK